MQGRRAVKIGQGRSVPLTLDQESGAAELLALLAGHPQEPPRRAKHAVEHRFGQPARERVLLAGVIAAQQPAAAGQLGLRRRARILASGRTAIAAACASATTLARRFVPGPRKPSRSSNRSSAGTTRGSWPIPRGSGLLFGGAQCSTAVIEAIGQFADHRRAKPIAADWQSRPCTRPEKANRRCGRR